jgi:hypothetical protein
MLSAWYFTSHNGDFRLQPHPDHPEYCQLSVTRPTADERHMLSLLQDAFATRDWLAEDDRTALVRSSWWRTQRITIRASIVEVGPVVLAIVKPGKNVLTAIRSADGTIEVCETSELAAPPEPKEDAAPKTDEPKPTAKADEPKADAKPETKPEPKAKELAAKPDAKAAATVRRATPCCPDCYVDDAVEPATEVLLSFLTPEQHRTWAASRYVVVRGQLTGHRYLLAHRHSPIATANKRIGYDLDDDAVMHFHDWSVPPEEEVLGAMLVLGHREPWLRNEATCLGRLGRDFRYVFKNPFGGGMDGVPDSIFTQNIGSALLRHLVPQPPRPPPRRHQSLNVPRELVPDGQGGFKIVDTTVLAY